MMHRRSWFVLPVLLAHWLRGAPALAQAPAVPEPVTRRVATLVAARWQVPATAVRLDWATTGSVAGIDTTASRAALVAERGGWFSVALPAVTGPDVARWRVRAGVAESTWVARTALPRNAVVTRAIAVDTVIVRWGRPARHVPGRLGWVAQRAIRPGEILQSPAVQPPPLIAAGDSIALVWQHDRIRLVVHGIAAERAAVAGDPVTVRLSGGRTLAGIAAGPHRATLNSHQ